MLNNGPQLMQASKINPLNFHHAKQSSRFKASRMTGAFAKLIPYASFHGLYNPATKKRGHINN